MINFTDQIIPVNIPVSEYRNIIINPGINCYETARINLLNKWMPPPPGHERRQILIPVNLFRDAVLKKDLVINSLHPLSIISNSRCKMIFIVLIHIRQKLWWAINIFRIFLDSINCFIHEKKIDGYVFYKYDIKS